MLATVHESDRQRDKKKRLSLMCTAVLDHIVDTRIMMTASRHGMSDEGADKVNDAQNNSRKRN